MATRRFDPNREQSVALISAGPAGNGNDDHLPMGKSSFNASIQFAGLIRFAHDWDGMVTVTKVDLKVRMSSGTHTAQGASDKKMRVQKANGSFTSGGGAENSWSTSASGTKWGEVVGHLAVTDKTMPDSDWVTIDITDTYMSYVPTSKGGGGMSNDGLYIRALDQTAQNQSFEIYGMRSSYPYYLIITYTTTPPNAAPTKPVITKPVAGTVFPPGTTSILVSFTGSDPDPGDTMSKWNWGWASGAAGSVTPPAGSGFNVTDHPLSVVGHAPGTDKLDIFTSDQDNLGSATSAPVSVTFSNGPSIPTGLSPGSGALADIHNAAELAEWTLGGAHAKPILKFTYQHTAARGMKAYRVRVYNDGLGTPIWDSTVLASGAHGTVVTVNVPVAIVLGTPYRWGVETQDVDGYWSPDMTPTQFKVRWGQAIYTEDTQPGGTGGMGRDFSWANATPAQGGLQFLYRLADDPSGTGATTWSTGLPTQPTSPKRYFQVLVRLWAKVAGQNPALANMTLTYTRGAAAVPDRWQNFSPANASVSLDPSVRRFSRFGLHVVMLNTSSHVLYPFRKDTLDGIDVVAGTIYTYSVYVKTKGPIGAGGFVRIGIRSQGGIDYPPEMALTPCDQDGAVQTNDTAGYPEGWQRLAGWFRVPDGTSIIQPDVAAIGATNDEYWIDGAKLEVGKVASTWVPGLLGAATFDRQGLQLDAQQGALFRMRSSGGALLELGPSGLMQDGLHAWSQGVRVGAYSNNPPSGVTITANNTTECPFQNANADPYGLITPAGHATPGRLLIPVGLGGLYLVTIHVDGQAPAGTGSTAGSYTQVTLGANPLGLAAGESLGSYMRFDTTTPLGLTASFVKYLPEGAMIWVNQRPISTNASSSRIKTWSITRIGSGYA